MGYTIKVKIEDKSKRDKIYIFLEKNLKDFNKEVFDYEHSNYLLEKEDKINSRTKKQEYFVGFHYNAGGAERTYIYEVIRWLSYAFAKEKSIYYYDGIRSKLRKSLNAEIKALAQSLAEVNKKRTLEDIIKSQEAQCYGYEMADKAKKFIYDEISNLIILFFKESGKN